MTTMLVALETRQTKMRAKDPSDRRATFTHLDANLRKALSPRGGRGRASLPAYSRNGFADQGHCRVRGGMTATARIAASASAGGCPHTCRAFRDLNLEGGRGAKLPGVAQRPRVEAKMRQVTVILVTAVLTVMVTVFSMMAKSSNSVR